jgi:hypothetical protein
MEERMATVNLTAEEQALLVRLLEGALGETRVEVHRTHFSPDFREALKQEEARIRALLAKLGQAPAGAEPTAATPPQA